MSDPTHRVTLPFREVSSRVSLIFMIALAAALLLLGRAETYLFDRARQAVTDLAAPLLEVASRPVAASRRLVERTDEYAYVFEENERLREENERLRSWREAALKLEAKSARYEALLNVQLDPTIEYVTGRVIGDSGGPFVDTVVVNVGRNHGARSGQAVIDTEGLVGRIVSTGANASRVLLLTDLNSRVPVTVEPSHYRAVLAGDNTAWPKLSYLPADAAASTGDRVVTSGHGGLIPPGLPVGVVISTSDGFLRVQTFADHGRLDFVRVLQYDFPSDVERQDPPDVLRDRPREADAVSGAAPATEGSVALDQSGAATPPRTVE